MRNDSIAGRGGNLLPACRDIVGAIGLRRIARAERLPPMKSFALAYLSAALAMLILDGVWLTLMGNRLYRAQIGHLMRPSFALAPAIVFYLIYVFGVTMFAVLPALAEGRIAAAVWRGALLGLIAYATYDLTNQATLRNWPLTITLADLCWGVFLTASAAAAGWWVTQRFLPHG